MAREPGLFMALGALGMHSTDKIKKLSMSTAVNLQRYATKMGQFTSMNAAAISAFKPLSAPSSSAAPARQPLKEVDANTPTSTNPKGAKLPSGSSSGTARRINQARTVTLFVKGLTTEDRRLEVESSLLRVKGVISFLIDLSLQKATIRTLTEADVLINAITSATGLRVSTKEFLSRRSPKTLAPSVTLSEVSTEDEEEDDEEDDSEGDSSDSEDDDGPKYLDEDENWNTSRVESCKYAIVTESDAKNPASNPATNGWFGRISKALWG